MAYLKPNQSAVEALRLILERAGFHNYSENRRIDLGATLGVFSPTYFFDDPNSHYEGVCICLDGRTTSNYEAIVDELRGRFYEVIEVQSEETTDLPAMKNHLFRLARVLIGRDPAILVRDNPTWFVAPSAEPSAPVGALNTKQAALPASSIWDECIELLDPIWRPLADGLRAGGMPSPTDVDWEIAVNGRVGRRRAVMVWLTRDAYVALVGDCAATQAEIEISPSSDPAAVSGILGPRLNLLGILHC
jgi:hypothetical protein